MIEVMICDWLLVIVRFLVSFYLYFVNSLVVTATANYEFIIYVAFSLGLLHAWDLIPFATL